MIGLSESINILHPSLKILGTLTDKDIEYLQAMKSVGLTRVMFSYVEKPADIEEIKTHLPGA